MFALLCSTWGSVFAAIRERKEVGEVIEAQKVALLVISNRASRGDQSLLIFFSVFISFYRSWMGMVIQFGKWVFKSLLWTDAIWGFCSLLT